MTTDYPTADEICAIAVDETRSFADEADVIARVYNRLALALARRVGADDLNWCGFAQWSSKAIGVSLRLDDGQFWTKTRRAFGIPRAFGWVFRVVMRTLLGGAYSKGLSIANRSIFLEVGTFYTNLLADDGVMYSNSALRSQRFEHPLIGELTDRQMKGLQEAMHLYRAAERATGGDRSQLILAANTLVSAHEQARVQGALEYVLHRPVRWLTRVSWRMPVAWLFRRELNRFDIYTQPHDEQPWLTKFLETKWTRGYVRALSLDVPGAQIVVGRPLIAATDRPAPLVDAVLVEPTASIVARFHRDPATRFAGVRDWLVYADRMRFIVSYFMIYQNDRRMFDLTLKDGPSLGQRVARITGSGSRWVTRTLKVPRIVDPALEELDHLAVRPEQIAFAAG